MSEEKNVIVQLEDELAKVNAEIAAHNPIDRHLASITLLRGELDIIESKIARLTYNSYGESLLGVKARADEIRGLHSRLPQEVAELRFSPNRLWAVVNTNRVETVRIATRMKALAHFEKMAGTKAAYLDTRGEKIQKEITPLESQCDAIRKKIVQLENVITNEREDAAAWTGTA